MFFLRNAWLMPAIPAVSFFAILLFGRRLPQKGSEIGIAAVGASFVLAVISAGVWIGRPHSGHLREAAGPSGQGHQVVLGAEPGVGHGHVSPCASVARCSEQVARHSRSEECARDEPPKLVTLFPK